MDARVKPEHDERGGKGGVPSLPLGVEFLVADGVAPLLFVQHEYHAREVRRVDVRPADRDAAILPLYRGGDGDDVARALQAALKDFHRRRSVQDFDLGHI